MIECKIFSSQSGKLGRPTVKYFTKVTRSYLPTLSTSCFLNIKVSLPQTRPPPIHSPATDPLIGTTHHRLNLPRCQHHPLIHLPEFFFFFFLYCCVALPIWVFGWCMGHGWLGLWVVMDGWDVLWVLVVVELWVLVGSWYGLWVSEMDCCGDSVVGCSGWLAIFFYLFPFQWVDISGQVLGSSHYGGGFGGFLLELLSSVSSVFWGWCASDFFISLFVVLGSWEAIVDHLQVTMKKCETIHLIFKFEELPSRCTD